jgi:hypothetical protein
VGDLVPVESWAEATVGKANTPSRVSAKTQVELEDFS